MNRFAIAAMLVCAAAFASAQTYDPSLFGGLKYRLIGPFRGGRALAVCGSPANPDRFYFGGVGGGVWQTDNDGRTWRPIFDQVPVASIGAIAVAPSDADTIYVGTGEADMRSDIQQGNGMYKSTDGGKTWTHTGLEDSRQIGRIVVDPKDPNRLFVAALGHQFGPNAERGVFRSEDGGQTWTKSLYKGPDIGAIDVAMDPTDSNTVFATLWSTRRPPWTTYPPSNGPGGGLFKSTDGGQTWRQISGHGFPDFVGKVGITVSPADHNRLYAAVDTNDDKDGGVYRSDDGGENWSRTDGEGRIWHRGWYFCCIKADPKDPDKVYVMNTSTYLSTDAGKTFTPIKGAPGGDDYHDLWIEPGNPNKMVLSSDQGVEVSVDGAKSWSSWYNQPTGQFYHVITDNRLPYWVYGAQQDSGAMAVPSRSMHTGISMMDWRPIDVGGESNTIAPDLLHPGVLLGSPGNKENVITGWNQDIDPTLAETDTVWRSAWTQPIIASPLDPKVFYVSHQAIFRTGDSGASWKRISPDLTRATVGPLPNLNEATVADDTGLKRPGVVYWIAPSPVKLHEIWAGTNDGLIWLTRDEGQHWMNVSPQMPGPWSKVGVIDASHFDSETAYAAIDRHRMDDNHPYIYRTHDGGRHWKLVVAGIPEGQFVNVVREDPRRKGLLYAGTDGGVFVSFNDGNEWQSLQLNLPAASVRDIVFHGPDIVVGTHGRAIWVLDDAGPLRQLSLGKAASAAVLFRPQPAMLYQRASGFGGGTSDEGTPLPPEEAQGQNPQWGALLDYKLSKESTVVFTIRDSNGKLVRKLSSEDKPRQIDLNLIDIPAYWFPTPQPMPTSPGAHRWVWNLHYLNDGGPLVPPGSYTIEMSADGQTLSQPLEVVRDPRLSATDEDLRAQFAFALELQAAQRRAQKEASDGQTFLREKGSGLPQVQRTALRALLGMGGGGGRRRGAGGTPDMGETTSQNLDNFQVLIGGLGGVERAVESAPSAPLLHYRNSYRLLLYKEARLVKRLRELMR